MARFINIGKFLIFNADIIILNMLNCPWQNEHNDEDINKIKSIDLYATDDDDFGGVNEIVSDYQDESSDD